MRFGKIEEIKQEESMEIDNDILKRYGERVGFNGRTEI
jgi:hypothetical protein